MSKAEFFDLAELPLNTPGQAWGNLGYWHKASGYSEACRDLALLLGERLQLNSGSVLFDAGFGCGDQLLLWLQQFQVRQLFGVNYSLSQTAYAKRRLQDLDLSAQADIRSGCVEQSEAWAVADDQGVDRRVDRIVALDCAYHFPCRQSFFQNASQLLGNSGRIGLTDFVVGRGFQGIARYAGGAMFRLSQIPRDNMVSAQRYRSELSAAGFSGIEIEDISADVMTGFRPWLQGFKAGNSGLMPRRLWLKYEATARFLDWAYRKDMLNYVVVTAEKVPKADKGQ